MTLALAFEDVHKTYRNGVQALRGLTLGVPKGAFFGLLGLNGAGKTTSLHIVGGLVRPTRGRVQVHGLDAVKRYREAHRLVGIAPQEVVLDQRFLNVRQILVYNAGYFGIPKRQALVRADRLLEDFGLTDKRQAGVQELSGGMKRRLLLAKALMHDPPLLLLDEPTAGADVALRHHIWDTLRRLNRQGKTVVLTTHYLEEVERLCDQVAILHGGAVAKTGPPKALGAVHANRVRLHTDPPLSEVPQGVPPQLDPTLDGHRLVVSGRLDDAEVTALMRRLAHQGHRVVSAEQMGTQLEEAFLELVGSASRGAGA